MKRYREPALTALVVMQAVWLFVLAPITQLRILPPAINFVATAAIVAIVLVVCSGNRAAELTVVIATLADITAEAIHAFAPSRATIGLDLAARLLFFSAVIWVVAAAVFGPGRVTVHRIQGAIAIELTLAMAFAILYRALDGMTAIGAFEIMRAGAMRHDTSFGHYVYFSFTTLTSTGYGDMVPVYPFARSAANLEALIGQLFPATLLARLVSLEIEARRGAS